MVDLGQDNPRFNQVIECMTLETPKDGVYTYALRRSSPLRLFPGRQGFHNVRESTRVSSIFRGNVTRDKWRRPNVANG